MTNDTLLHSVKRHITEMRARLKRLSTSGSSLVPTLDDVVV
jgi:hypothetical protein